MHKKSISCYVVLLFIAISLVLATTAQSASIKERMAARIPAINALKDTALVGENSKGFLEYRTAKKPQAQLITDENKDRGTVYQAIGKKQGAKAALVGQRRAVMIAQKGKAGHWFQKKDGSWFKK